MLYTLQDVKVIGKKINHKDLRGSVRLFLRLLMTKDLAMKYSWSGFGAGRKKTKLSFKDTEAFGLLKGKLDSILRYFTEK